MFDELRRRGFQVEFLSHAHAILNEDFAPAAAELEAALLAMSIPIEEIVGSGGGEAKGTQRLRRALAAAGWVKTIFTIEKRINGVQKEQVSHEVDHVRSQAKGVVALEIEWNNKDPFFDRDLENFKRLHAEGAISVGVIVTRGASLQEQMPALLRRFAAEKRLGSLADVQALGLLPTRRQQADIERRLAAAPVSFAEAWAAMFCADKFGASTTHWRKLEDRIHRGVGSPCPLVLIGLSAGVVSFGEGLEVSTYVDDDQPMLF